MRKLSIKPQLKVIYVIIKQIIIIFIIAHTIGSIFYLIDYTLLNQ